jgi:hypothetical protein
MFNGRNALVTWFANLFNPPPLAAMNQGQKMARIFLVALTLVLLCIVAAVFAASVLVLAGRAQEMMSEPTALAGTEILFVGALGSALCWRTLLMVSRSEKHAG